MRCHLAILLALLSTNAVALSYSEWLTTSDQWKRGYAFAYVEYAKTFATDAVSRKWAHGYDKCFATVTDEALVKMVDDYLSRNPTIKTKPMLITLNFAYRELCAEYLPAPPKKK